MQFLDAIGLASFWKKIKNWVNINYLSLTGGTIRGSVSFLNEADGGKSIRIDPSNITNSRYGVNYLFASGKMIPIGEANGVAVLDANGNVPLAQLGNLDTTVAEVVTALPTTNIKKHIYLIKDASGVTQNQYEEYIYTGDTSATYDASKWEKLGDFRATLDLADYAKKSETVNLSEIKVIQNVLDSTPQGQVLKQVIRFSAIKGGTRVEIALEDATSNMAGLMSIRDKNKLDRIAEGANNYSLPLAANGTRGGIQVGYTANGRNYPVQLSGEKAYVNVPWTDTNTTYDLSPYAKKMETVDFSSIRLDKRAIANTPQGLIEEQIILFNTLGDNVKSVEIVLEEAASNMSGLMSIRDKNKLDYIADRATADSAIPISVIDALN